MPLPRLKTDPRRAGQPTSGTRKVQIRGANANAEAADQDAVWSNPALKDFKDAEGTDPEIAADVIDLVKTFQQIMERARSVP